VGAQTFTPGIGQTERADSGTDPYACSSDKPFSGLGSVSMTQIPSGNYRSYVHAVLACLNRALRQNAAIVASQF
jgi:hypothetical protein